MKNIFKIAVLIFISVLFVTSCESKPKPQPEPEPEPTVQVEEVSDDTGTTVEATEITVKFTEYTVKKGDTLSQIAERFYGSKDKAYFFPIIIAYSADSTMSLDVDNLKINISDPDVIEPGTVIRVPDFDQFMASPTHVVAAKLLFERIAVQYENKGRTGVAKMLRERAQRLGK